MERHAVSAEGAGEPTLLHTLRADIEATTHQNYRLYSNARFWSRALAKLLISPNVRAVVSFRVSHALAARGLMPLALWLRSRTLRIAGAEIHPSATIGPGLLLVHSSGVVVGPDSVIGSNCRLHQGVTVGGPVHAGGTRWAGAKIGDHVMIGAHAVVLGDVTIGDGAEIGAQAVVTRDVAPYEVVAGVPAVVVGTRHPSPPD